jgi:REP element-mobilizing transposase RayT
MPEAKGFYRRALPHFTPNDAPYFVTYRLADTLPGDLIRKAKFQNEEGTMPFREYDRLLDRAQHGNQWLKDGRLAGVVCESLHFWAEKRYTLWAFTVMSNHVHVALSLNDGENLWDVLQSLKSFTARKCNQILQRHGEFWQHESYDHVIRQNEFGKIIFYILRNPVKAGLVTSVREWPYSYVNPSLEGFDDTEYLQNSVLI